MNPEFRRYTWLELSPLRLWALPLVLLALGVVINAWGGPERPPGLNYEGIRSLGLTCFSIFTIWGAHKSAQSVTSEVVSSTWDLQRMAGHQPWELLVGKLFGSTVFDWLGVAAGLALFAVGSTANTAPGVIALDLLILALATLWLHSLALVASLAGAAGLRTTRRPGGTRQSGSLIVLLIVALWLGPSVFGAISSGSQSGVTVPWWWPMPASQFVALSLAMFIFWTLLGAHRQVRAELQEPVSPAPWIGCLIFLTAYVFPFVPAEVLNQLRSPLATFSGVALVVCGVLYYPLMLGERKDVVRARSLAAAWQRGDARTVWTIVPLWVFNLVGYALATVGLIVSAVLWPAPQTWTVVGVALSFGAFMLRDLCWILAVHLAPNPGRRPDLVVFFFLAVLYGLIPALLAVTGEAGRTATFLFLPGMGVAAAAEPPGGPVLLHALYAVPGLVLAVAFMVMRLRRVMAPVPDPQAAEAATP